jgi:hypothetical protein
MDSVPGSRERWGSTFTSGPTVWLGRFLWRTTVFLSCSSAPPPATNIRKKPSSKALINECIKDVIFVRYYKYSNALALFFLLHVDTPLFRRTSVILIHVVIR